MAKKKQVTAKVEKRKSVENRCDYARLNGKCGRAMCDNFGKSCPGRSCEDWSCDAEGGAVPVVVPNGAATYKTRVSEAYGRVEAAKDNLLRECVKFGALLTEVEDFLGNEERRQGSGLKGWLEENCPEVNYNTAQGYKAMAAKCVRMIGGGSQAVAVLQDKTEVIPPGEDAPIEVESKFVEKRDELFSEVKSRRELEQMWFEFCGKPVKGKKSTSAAEKAKCRFCDPSGTCCCKKSKHFDEGCPAKRCDMFERESYAKTAEDRIAEAEEQTRELMGKIGAYFRGKWFETVSEQTKNDFIRSLKDWAEVASERM